MDSAGARNCTAIRKTDAKFSVGTTLTDFVTMFPTPQAFDANDGCAGKNLANRKKKGSCSSLKDMVHLWTTPTASDDCHRKTKYAQGGTPLSMQAGGKLNPTWVEWLMGVPLGWTALDALEHSEMVKWERAFTPRGES